MYQNVPAHMSHPLINNFNYIGFLYDDEEYLNTKNRDAHPTASRSVSDTYQSN